MKNRITLKELIIKAVPFRVDGEWHDYAIYIKSDDEDINLWGCAGSEAVYKPGELVELEDGRTACIDREL